VEALILLIANWRQTQVMCELHVLIFIFSFIFDLGNTSGLLGLWDGNQEQEFLLPNGSFLETNSSHRRIHNLFGQLCKSAPI